MSTSRRLLVLTRNREGASFRQRVAAYLPALAERGIESDVAELARGPLARRRQLARGSRYDGVWLHRKTLSGWDAGALRRNVRRLIYDFDDAIMYQSRTIDRGVHPGRMRRFRRTVGMADVVIAGSPVLAEHVAKCGARAVVIPTGLDLRRYAPKRSYDGGDDLRLVWIGSRSTMKRLEPFRDMLSALGREVPGVTLRIIADAELAVPGLTVENLAWSREAEARLLSESDVGIAPLPDTPFTRGKCGFKILQYMAAALPVVASPVGVNADYVRQGESGFHARDVREWVEAVRNLAADASLRERLGRTGRQRVESEFDTAVLAPRVAELVHGVLAE